MNEENINEASARVVCEVNKEVTNEVNEEVTCEMSEKITNEVNEDIAYEVDTEITRESAEKITREAAWELLKEYNKDDFHLQHALTVEACMRYFAFDGGYEDEVDFWGMVGLLHDIDFEMYPDRHCVECQKILEKRGFGVRFIRAVASHGYGICVDIRPEHYMEKVLYAVDELTGLIWATALVRPSRSVMDLEVKSVRKKYKTPTFAAGCSREVIANGAEMLGWELDELIGKTICAMQKMV